LEGSISSGSSLIELLDANAQLVMNNNVVLEGNTTPTPGGAVWVYGSGEFIMNGGIIRNNTGGVSGGGVSVDSGVFKMASGSIENNNAVSGGGVFIDTGIFEMKGGSVAGNTASSLGHGVCTSSGNFSWTGGSISITDIKKSYGADTWDLKGWDRGSAFAPAGPMPAAWNGDASPVWSGDGSTVATATAITSLAELAAIGSNATTLGLCYDLAADITIGGIYWTPLGDNSDSFEGKFNGNGHTITFDNTAVTTVATSASNRGAGLFGRISGSSAAVSNLKLTGNLTCTLPAALTQYHDIGVIAGYVFGGAEISSCGSEVNLSVDHSASIPSISQNVTAGGIVGLLDGGEISNCYNRGDITNYVVHALTNVYAGGIVGSAENGGTTIGYCYTSGAVISATNGTAGGVVGYSAGTVDLSYLVALNTALIGDPAKIHCVLGDYTGSPILTFNHGLWSSMSPGGWISTNLNGTEISPPTDAFDLNWWSTSGTVWVANWLAPWYWDSDNNRPEL
jgi:hypothetical protein